MICRHMLFGTLAMLGIGISPVDPATAQPYPARPIKLIVPFPAGGPPDVIARVLADSIGPRLGQTVVVENRPGAGATIGTRSVAAAEADGYTLLFASTTSLSIAPALFRAVDYDPVKSFAPVAGGGASERARQDRGRARRPCQGQSRQAQLRRRRRRPAAHRLGPVHRGDRH